MSDPAQTTNVTAPAAKSLRKLYKGDEELGRAPFTKWGAKRLIDRHQDAIAYNLRLLQLLKSHREELLNGVLPYTVRAKVKNVRSGEIGAVIAAVLGVGGAFALNKAGAPPFLAPLAAYGASGWALGKINRIMSEMRRYPEHAVVHFVAPAELKGAAREKHGEFIDQAAGNLQSANEEHRLHIGALRQWLGIRVARKAELSRTREEVKARVREERQKAAEEKRINTERAKHERLVRKVRK